MNNTTTSILDLLAGSQNIMITSHIQPDPDAICSMIALYDFLTKKYANKNIQMYISAEINNNLNFLKHFEAINWMEDIYTETQGFDTIFFLDGNEYTRFTRNKDKLNLENIKTICLDHHPKMNDNYTIEYIDTHEASATQIIYRLFFRNFPETLDKEIAEVILSGIMQDTGTLRYLDYTRSDTLIMVKELMDIGEFNLQTIDIKFSQLSNDQMEILKVLIANTILVDVENVPPLMYTFLPLSFLDKFDINTIKDAADKYKFMFLRQIKGYNWGFIVTPNSKMQIGISFRSTPGCPNVRPLAQLFTGGGHPFAAAGSYNIKDGEQIDSEQVCKIVIEKIKNAKMEIT